MRRRNLVAAVISILLLIGLMALMLFIAFSNLFLGLDVVDRLVLGGVNMFIWIGVSLLAIPVFIFVMITIVWLVMEARRATRDPNKRRWLSPKASPQTSELDHQYATGQISQDEYVAEKDQTR